MLVFCLRKDMNIIWVKLLLLEDSGFNRTNTVREYGEYAIRGDIVDIFSNPSFYPIE